MRLFVRLGKSCGTVSHRLNGAVLIGLALVSLSLYHPPVKRGDKLGGFDILSDALWAGCKSQAIKRISVLVR